ncbi:MAG: NAD(P)/FAD-dependent oxidoreductase [Rhizobiales bacterium]|nr:NAD(P)/FAD-dependent oxidoreductase [Hyphomicrobiales bacterium]NRB14687.1 NAD(P)/FAD-dependent oxidoreductase [Hyphomicrobiales bacterium]
MAHFDVVILGAGAAGLMCAIEAGKNGRSVVVLERNRHAAQKIRISGGGRCNFTNINTDKTKFISENKNFCISALKRYTPQDFIKLVDEYKIDYHEKTLGQYFCDDSAMQIIELLLDQCEQNGVEIVKQIEVKKIEKNDGIFTLITDAEEYSGDKLVLATGGPSIPKMGASSIGYIIAKQFGHSIIDIRPGLVPLTFSDDMKGYIAVLAGISIDNVEVSVADKKIKQKFREALLFTHRGLSGPAILQISSFWREGKAIVINMLPDVDMFEQLLKAKKDNPKQLLHNMLSKYFAKKLAVYITEETDIDGQMGGMSDKKLQKIADMVNRWHVMPNGSEGNRTAEVTLGGVNTKEISSQSFESQKTEGLYIIGELLDVTGYLGGYNFQWAWASGYAAGRAL